MRENARRLATPLFIVLILVEITDLVFAVDSIPAIFAVTTRPLHRPDLQHLRDPGAAVAVLPPRGGGRPAALPLDRAGGHPGLRRPEDPDRRHPGVLAPHPAAEPGGHLRDPRRHDRGVAARHAAGGAWGAGGRAASATRPRSPATDRGPGVRAVAGWRPAGPRSGRARGRVVDQRPLPAGRRVGRRRGVPALVLHRRGPAVAHARAGAGPGALPRRAAGVPGAHRPAAVGGGGAGVQRGGRAGVDGGRWGGDAARDGGGAGLGGRRLGAAGGVPRRADARGLRGDELGRGARPGDGGCDRPAPPWPRRLGRGGGRPGRRGQALPRTAAAAVRAGAVAAGPATRRGALRCGVRGGARGGEPAGRARRA